MTVGAALLSHARRDPGRRALTTGEVGISYGELAARIGSVGAWLRSRCRPDARVGLLLPSGHRFLEVFLGAGHVGMAAMVLPTGWSERELRLALDAGRPELVVTTSELATRSRGALAAWQVVELEEAGAWIPPDGLPAPCGGEVAPPPDDGAAFYVGFTSGTTGGPKGFVRDHRSWLRSFEACRVFGIHPSDEVAVPGELAHSLFLFAALHALAEGAGVHLQRRFDASRVDGLLEDEPITRLYVVPTMLAALLTITAVRSSHARPRLRSVISSGAPWSAPMLDRVTARFPGAEVIDFYGSSECSFVSYRRVRADDPPNCLGRPFTGVELRVGASGRLSVRSGMVFSGYLDPSATPAVRDGDGFVATGDVVEMDDDQRLRLVGRADAMLICGGTNVHPEEIERVLEHHPDVLEAVVVGADDAVWGQLPYAVIRLDPRRWPSRGGLRVHCRRRLAGPARPRRFLVVDALPRTPNGKPDRRLVAAQVAAGTLDAEILR